MLWSRSGSHRARRQSADTRNPQRQSLKRNLTTEGFCLKALEEADPATFSALPLEVNGRFNRSTSLRPQDREKVVHVSQPASLRFSEWDSDVDELTWQPLYLASSPTSQSVSATLPCDFSRCAGETATGTTQRVDAEVREARRTGFDLANVVAHRGWHIFAPALAQRSVHVFLPTGILADKGGQATFFLCPLLNHDSATTIPLVFCRPIALTFILSSLLRLTCSARALSGQNELRHLATMNHVVSNYEEPRRRENALRGDLLHYVDNSRNRTSRRMSTHIPLILRERGLSDGGTSIF